jgi:hypothetical protein
MVGILSKSVELAIPRTSNGKTGKERDSERLRKYCSHSVKGMEGAVFLVFGFVSAQSQGFANLLLRRSLAKNQKSSLRIGYSIFLTAPSGRYRTCA